MKSNLQKRIRYHELFAAANGALIIFIGVAVMYGQKVLHFLPPEQEFNYYRFMIYGIWAAHGLGLIMLQILLVRSRKRLIAASSSPSNLPA